MSLSKKDYYNYIKSEDWQKMRKKYYASGMRNLFKLQGKWKCYCCLTDNVPLDLHHRTYKRLGEENLHDLVPVCRSCHDLIHELFDSNRISLWSATKRIKNRFARKVKKQVRRVKI
jgi:5-methylcytosine-specific restriction endonuclease McrA